jgi:ribosomal protein S18 acetylase RimI-like enzyme
VTPPVVVRPVRPEEYDVLGELTVAAYRALAEGDDPALDPAYLAELRAVARRAAEVPVLVAVDARGRVLGGVTYVPGPGTRYSESEAPDEAGIRMLAVDPRLQGRGIGRLLVEACLARAKAAGRRRLVLLTRPSMVAARRLYARLGFRRAPARDWEFLPGEWLLGYEIDLADGVHVDSPIGRGGDR